MENFDYCDLDGRDTSDDIITEERSYSLESRRSFIVLPRRCAYSNKWMWMQFASKVCMHHITRIDFEFRGNRLNTTVQSNVEYSYISKESELFLTVSNRLDTYLSDEDIAAHI